MRTNIDIDDGLMKEAMAATGATTKKAAVEAGLRLAIQRKKQERIKDGFGKIDWEGDLEAMRASRFPDWDEGKLDSTEPKKDENAA